MKRMQRIQQMFQQIGPTVARFPLTFLCLLILTILMSLNIMNSQSDYSELMATFLAGAFAFAVAQMIYERFYSSNQMRWIAYGGALLFTVLVYILLTSRGLESLQDTIRMSLLIGGLGVAFVWVPSIKNKVPFHFTLFAGLRAWFLASLFSLVLFIGLSLILSAINQLLFDLPTDTFLHVTNPVYTFIGPLLFLLWIPRFPGKWLSERDETVQEAAQIEVKKVTSPAKSVEWLISYIVIPLIAIFTIILVLYLIQNITGNFWTDNVLEPMLVTYTTIGILVYLLASTIDNTVTSLFLRWYPLVLVPLVVFQTIASFLRMQEIGLTHGRYFTLLTGIFTIIAGFILIRFRSRRNGWIALLLLVFIAVSIIPPFDAFTTSRNYYVRQMENVMQQNGILQDGEIVPVEEETIPEEDKLVLVRSYNYLSRMNELDHVQGIENGFGSSQDFVQLFGFYPGDRGNEGGPEFEDYRSAMVSWDRELLFDVQGFDQLTQIYFDGRPSSLLLSERTFVKNGVTYRFYTSRINEEDMLVLETAEEGETLVEMNLVDAFEQVLSSRTGDTGEVTLEEATITSEADEGIIEMIVLSISQYSGDLVLKIGVK